MTATRKLTIEVSEALAERLTAQVAKAGYASTDALVIDSLEVYLDHSRYDGSNPEIERWLCDQVLPAIERRNRDKTPDILEDDVQTFLKTRREARHTVA